MYRHARNAALPPQITRLPRILPLSRLNGATPTRAAACRRVSADEPGQVVADAGRISKGPDRPKPSVSGQGAEGCPKDSLAVLWTALAGRTPILDRWAVLREREGGEVRSWLSSYGIAT